MSCLINSAYRKFCHKIFFYSSLFYQFGMFYHNCRISYFSFSATCMENNSIELEKCQMCIFCLEWEVLTSHPTSFTRKYFIYLFHLYFQYWNPGIEVASHHLHTITSAQDIKETYVLTFQSVFFCQILKVVKLEGL